MQIRIVILMGFLGSFFGCSRGDWVEGGLYCTPKENGSYSVLKILKIDDGGVHVRLYSNEFSEPPKKLDESTLYIAGFDRKSDEGLGMGHIPLSHQSFSGWRATFVQKSTVREAELEGYKMWLDAKGGYF